MRFSLTARESPEPNHIFELVMQSSLAVLSRWVTEPISARLVSNPIYLGELATLALCVVGPRLQGRKKATYLGLVWEQLLNPFAPSQILSEKEEHTI
jgi:hypothetical protein